MRANKISKSLDYAISDRKVSSLGALPVLNFLDSVRLQTGKDSSGQLSREVKPCFCDSCACGSIRSLFYFDIRGDAAAAIENSADCGLHSRSRVWLRSWRSQRQRRLDVAVVLWLVFCCWLVSRVVV